MARYKDYSYAQSKLLPISYEQQILPGTFEYTLSHLIDEEMDLSAFDECYRNDESGAPAYDPRILLKVVLLAYSRGIFSSRRIERACRENVVFMALSADAQPHWTTLAQFISGRQEAIVALFREVLLVCETLGLLGKELFAIDGLKLPSNASKEWSGTHEDLRKKQKKLERAIRVMMKRHREADEQELEPEVREDEEQYLETLRRRVRKLKGFLTTAPENRGAKGTLRQSNVTDRESAKMKTSHGVVQGYTGVAAVDEKHQVIVRAQAYGEGQEHGLLKPMVEGVREAFQELGAEQDIFASAKLTADAGYHTEENMKYVFDEGIDAYIADRQMRGRDPRFAQADRHKERHREERRQRSGKPTLFKSQDFDYDAQKRTCICPAGKSLYRNGSNVTVRGFVGVKFTAPQSACSGCTLRAQCLRHPQRTKVRQVVFFKGRAAGVPETFTAKMKRRIDSAKGKLIYRLRLATAEPPFADIRHAKGLNRFTLRGRKKVNGQWQLYCIVHNLGKVHRYAPA